MGRKYLRSFKLNNKNSGKMNFKLLQCSQVSEKNKTLTAMEYFFISNLHVSNDDTSSLALNERNVFSHCSE